MTDISQRSLLPGGACGKLGGPQWAHFTGDAFTCRYDEVIQGLEMKKKCVNNV